MSTEVNAALEQGGGLKGLDPSSFQFPSSIRHQLKEHIAALKNTPEGAHALEQLKEMGFYIADYKASVALKDPVLLLQLIELQQKVVLSLKSAEEGQPCSAIYFAHNLQQLMEVLSVEGAQLLVIKRKGEERIYGECLYHVDGHIHAAEDDKLYETVQNYLKTQMPEEEVAKLRIGVSHLIVIDPDFSELCENLGLPRGIGYTAFQQFKYQEEKLHHIDLTIGTCRVYPSPNICAFERHEELARFEDTKMRITCTMPTDPSRIVVSAVMVAKPQSPVTVDLPLEVVDSNGEIF